MHLSFSKYHGTGNDFIIADNRSGSFKPSSEIVQALCDRRFGIGADGLILIESHSDADFLMNYFNRDGSQSFCGNGSRCAVSFFRELTGAVGALQFEAIDGRHYAISEGDNHRIAMRNCGWPQELDEGHYLHTGSPHVVVYVEDAEAVNVEAEGRRIRNGKRWRAEGTNVNFVTRKEDVLYVRTYERGVEHETLSCGTGVTAVALIDGWQHGGNERRIFTPGGMLTVRWKVDSKGYTDIELAGPAQKVFTGVVDLGQ